MKKHCREIAVFGSLSFSHGCFQWGRVLSFFKSLFKSNTMEKYKESSLRSLFPLLKGGASRLS